MAASDGDVGRRKERPVAAEDVIAKMAPPAIVDGLLDARARASEAMDGILGRSSLAGGAGEAIVSPSMALPAIVLFLSLWHSVMPSIDEAFALVPHHTIFSPVASCPVPFLWNIVTAHFFEGNLLKSIAAAPWLVALSRLLERLWPARSVIVHLLVTACCSGACEFLVLLINVQRTHKEKDFFEPVRGCAGLLVTLAVGLRHAYPFEALPLLPRHLGLQCQHLPFGLTVFFVVVGLILPSFFPEWRFALFSLFFAWLYLRYLMWFPYAQAHGDHSAEFTFAGLFPRQLRPAVACFGDLVYGISVAVVPGFARLREADGSLGQSLVYDPSAKGPANGFDIGSVPKSTDPEYHARRAKALALLDENIDSLLAGGKATFASDSGPGGGPNRAAGGMYAQVATVDAELEDEMDKFI